MPHNVAVMQNNPGHQSYPDGVLMQNGKVMQVKNGQLTQLQNNDLTFSNGTRIMSDGTWITKDGTKTMMKEGQHMDMSGNLITTNRDKYMNVNSNEQSYPIDRSNPDGVLMQNGKMMRVKNGQMTLLQDNDLIMGNGTRIMSDGTWITKDGTKTMMKEGQRMDMSGNMIPAKTNPK
jgi:flagellar basal body rod protein FlgG